MRKTPQRARNHSTNVVPTTRSARPQNVVGPVLNGLFGRKSGMIEGYNYSDANKNSGIAWDEAVFADYIKDPKAKIPGTKMSFAGIKNEQEVRDQTAFLKQFAKDGRKN